MSRISPRSQRTQKAPELDSFEYYNMMLCHAISKGDELLYVKTRKNIMVKLKKVSVRGGLQDELHQLVATRELKEATGAMTIVGTFKNFLSIAMKTSIALKRELISFDIIEFAAAHRITLTVTLYEVK